MDQLDILKMIILPKALCLLQKVSQKILYEKSLISVLGGGDTLAAINKCEK